MVTSTGLLKLYRHNGWQSGTPSWSVWTIGSGWRDPQVLAPTGSGVLYRQYGGKLYWYKHSDPSGGPVTWQARAVGSGWRFSDLVPAGRGVLYGVNAYGYVRAYNHTGSATGAATWDDVHDKGRIAAALGMVLAPRSCPG